jgi:polyisoprenoid-binding protein YceI
MKLVTTLGIAVLFLFWNSSSMAQSWNVKSATVSFKIKNAGFSIKGSFGGFKGTIVFSPSDLSSAELRGTVDVSTIDTGVKMRDNHLKSEDYFDAGKYPTLSMVGKKITKTDKGYTGQFDIKIKGVTKQLAVPFTFTEQGKSGTFSADFDINRLDFGVGGRSLVMSNTAAVTVVVNVEKK